MTRAFVDTNVWVYAVDAGDPAKRATARSLLEPMADRDYVISAQVLSEFYVVATRKLQPPLAEETAEAMVREMARLPVVGIDAELVAGAIAGSRDWGLSLWDATIIRAAQEGGCELLLTEDLADGASFDGLLVSNPFR